MADLYEATYTDPASLARQAGQLGPSTLPDVSGATPAAGATPTTGTQATAGTASGTADETATAASGAAARTTSARTHTPAPAPDTRHQGALPTRAARVRYFAILAGIGAFALSACFALLAWDNPMPVGSEGFWLIANLRSTNIAIIIIVAFCQAMATVAFQTVTHNRIITPSIMGFESLYTLIHTSMVFFFGTAGIVAAGSTSMFLTTVGIMVVFAAFLYGWLLSGRYANMQIMLLIGIILGAGLGSLSTFMQRLMTPGEFDLLTARLIGSISNAEASHLWIAAPIVAVAGGALWLLAPKLNVLALGHDTAVNLGLNQRAYNIIVLLIVSVLMAISTALIGPMTFFGFLVAMLAYQLADTHDHRYVFPLAWITGVAVLAGAYFALKHLFYAEGAVGIIIEVVGGSFFLLYVLRKGRL
ncbi:iron chelate uptake ABC transporter family permease subunit [Brevibacterium luteolum]|uniref:iron chelate uptake ABC transporter family permease subunit n=1 Tax=Brevibacterium luteolum TaxID=199591 RepID=UPI0021AF5442|nr:iron chelate uptake ABC transporter family permease subunit [Brevibacterium luteolum]MCT1656976.1 iron chelate uptake ABC transporter family permease subunit [Brevibacterium luteolum]